MKYKYRLVEQIDGGEENPIGSGSSREKTKYDITLFPTSVSIQEVIKALEDIDNYGAYVSNLRNTRQNVDKAIMSHFGPDQRLSKLKAEKERGKPFPLKTRTAISDFIKSLKLKPNLLKWDVKEDLIIFPVSKNPSKKVTKNIIDTVMKNANIDYTLKNEETNN